MLYALCYLPFIVEDLCSNATYYFVEGYSLTMAIINSQNMSEK